MQHCSWTALHAAVMIGARYRAHRPVGNLLASSPSNECIGGRCETRFVARRTSNHTRLPRRLCQGGLLKA
eukprot:5561539-Pyramimonas_sp.AAC.1